MPEVVTKYPTTLLTILRGGGARCGPDQTQKVLKRCPPERFCTTPTGEICVYGLDQVTDLQQITRDEFAARICKQNDGCQFYPDAASQNPSGELLVAAFAAIVVGWALRSQKPRPRFRA